MYTWTAKNATTIFKQFFVKRLKARLDKLLDPGLQGTGSAFRGRLRVVAFDPQ